MLNEGLVLGHRPFFVMGGEVHLDIYDDRIALKKMGVLLRVGSDKTGCWMIARKV